MCPRSSLVGVCLALGLCLALAAPLLKEKPIVREKRQSETQKVQDQEKQLEQLVALAGSKAAKPNTAVEKSHEAHTEVINGHSLQHEKTEEKVTDLKSGQIVADVKQEVTQTGAGKDVVVDTKVDLPAEGVHKEFVQHPEAGANEQPEVSEESIEFSPRAVAEYLYQTREFPKFYAALGELVNISVMTQSEADAYQRQVAAEYQNLAAQMETLGEQDDSMDLSAYEKRSSDLDLSTLYGRRLPLDRDLVRQALVENQNSLNHAIDSLLQAWWTQAYQNGDPQAQNLINYLYYIYGKDKNPDAKVRETLGDMLANALLDDLTSPESNLGEEGDEIPFQEVSELPDQVLEEQEEADRPRPDTPTPSQRQVKQEQETDKKKKETKQEKITVGKPNDKKKKA